MIFIFSPNHVWPEQVPFEVKIPSINDDDRAGELNNFANTNSDNEKNPKPVNWRRWMDAGKLGGIFFRNIFS
jgi:hypothetical protein